MVTMVTLGNYVNHGNSGKYGNQGNHFNPGNHENHIIYYHLLDERKNAMRKKINFPWA